MLLPRIRPTIRRQTSLPRWGRARPTVEALERRELLSLAAPLAVPIPAPVVHAVQTAVPSVNPNAAHGTDVTQTAAPSVPATTSLGSVTPTQPASVTTPSASSDPGSSLSTTLTSTSSNTVTASTTSVFTVTTATTIGSLTSQLTVSILVVTVSAPPTLPGVAGGGLVTSLSDALVRSTSSTPTTAGTSTLVIQIVAVRPGPVLITPLLFLTPTGPTQPVRPVATAPATENNWSALDPGYFIVGDEQSLIEDNKPLKPQPKVDEKEQPQPPREAAPAALAALPHLAPLADHALAEESRIELSPPVPPAFPLPDEPASESVALPSLLVLLGCGAVQENVWTEYRLAGDRRVDRSPRRPTNRI